MAILTTTITTNRGQTPRRPTATKQSPSWRMAALTQRHRTSNGLEAISITGQNSFCRRGHTVKHKSKDKEQILKEREFEQLISDENDVLSRLRVKDDTTDVTDCNDVLLVTSDSSCNDVSRDCDCWALMISLYMYLFNNLCLLIAMIMNKWGELNDTGEDGHTSISRRCIQGKQQLRRTQVSRNIFLILTYLLLLLCPFTLANQHNSHNSAAAYDSNTFDLQPQTINLEQSIAAVFNKVAYGSTTKRSIPDSAAAAGAYPVTTLATPLLTTYRYSDGNGEEYFRVDVKDRDRDRVEGGLLVPGRDIGRSNYDYDQTADEDRLNSDNMDTPGSNTYGADLEKDHVLPTSAPAADILKNNNNRHYDNPNRYNNDRLKPSYDLGGIPGGQDSATESMYNKATTTSSSGNLRNVRPTKSIYTKDVPSYVPPSRAFFTPPLPPEYLSPFADKPTLRGTNSDSYANRRPIPPPSIMPKGERVPFRPDMPNKVINMDRTIISETNNKPLDQLPNQSSNGRTNIHHSQPNQPDSSPNRKKTLNTPSQTVNNVNIDRLGEFYGLNRNNHNLSDSSSLLNGGNAFEYEKTYNIPSITRILSGSNGRSDTISEILLRTVTATPPPQHPQQGRGNKPTRMSEVGEGDEDLPRNSPKIQTPEGGKGVVAETSERVKFDEGSTEREITQHSSSSSSSPNSPPIGSNTNPLHSPPLDRSLETISTKHNPSNNNNFDLTTQSSEYVNLPNVKQKKANVTLATSEEIWFISWNVHVYLVVLCYVVLALFSIYKLIRYENDPHMFSKSYFLTIHLMLTVICVLRIFYLTYDPYNVDKSFNIFLYDFLHNFPLSLLATTFAVLILFLLKRTLTHLKVKTRPVFLVVFGLIHIFMCFFLSIFETLGHFDRAGLIVCKPVFVLLAWALGFSYLYLYKIIKNVLAKKSQNLSEMCTQNIGYASHITIAVALLFLVLGCVQLYALFCIKVDRFNAEIKHHWILWGFELSVRLLEISIITLLAIVVSLKLSQREKQTVGFPLFPCTTSESSSDNIYPNNCNTNPNALNYSRNEMIMENLPNTDTIPNERPNLLKNTFNNHNLSDSFEKKSTLERYPASNAEPETTGRNFDRFERPKWSQTSDRFESFGRASVNSGSEQVTAGGGGGVLNNFDRVQSNTSGRSSGGRKYDTSGKYYVKPKYDVEYNNEDYQHDAVEQRFPAGHHVHQNSHSSSHSSSTATNPPTQSTHSTDQSSNSNNVYSEPLDMTAHQLPATHHQYERTRHEFERSDLDRRSRSSGTSNGGGGNGTSGRRSTTGRSRNKHAAGADRGGGESAGGSGRRYAYGVGMQTLPASGGAAERGERAERTGRGREETMLVDDQGFLRFRHMQDLEYNERSKRSHKQRPSMNDVNHYSDA